MGAKLIHRRLMTEGALLQEDQGKEAAEKGDRHTFNPL